MKTISTLIMTSAISAVAVAGTPGGGENYCHLTWDKQCCPVPGCDVGIAPGVLTICTEKGAPAEYHWELIDVSGMGLQFMPQNGVAAPGNTPTGAFEPCIDIPFTVICPPKFPVGSVADYQAIVTKVGTNETFTCFGNVVNHSEWKLTPAGDPVIDVPILSDGTMPATSPRGQLVVSNIGSSGKDGVSIDLEPMGPFGVSPTRIQIPPIAPGSSFSVDSFFDIWYKEPAGSRGAPGGTVTGDILFKIDVDGDGVSETVIGSQTVRGVQTAAPCPGDINGDGVIDSSDLGLLIGVFGTGCP